MANAAITTPSAASRSGRTVGRLHRLRTRLISWFIIDGLSRAFAALVLLIAIDLLTDWFFEMDLPQRIVMLVLIATFVGFIVWRRLVKPLMQQVSDDALCLQVEQAHRQLGESLISALQFSRQEDFESRGVSQQMVGATMDQGFRAAEDVVFEKTLHSDRFLANLILLVVSLGALIGIAIAATLWDPLKIWYQRNILLSSEVQWPQNTVFVIAELQDGVLIIPRGDNWELIARVDPDSKQFPDDAQIEIRRGGQYRLESMQPLSLRELVGGKTKQAGEKSQTGRQNASGGNGEKPAAFRYRFSQVFEPLEFRVRCSSGRTGWIPVRLVNRPAVDTLTLSALPPNYTLLNEKKLPPRQAKHKVLVGSWLQITGVSTKPLSAAYLRLDNKNYEMQHDGKKFWFTLPGEKLREGTYEVRLIDRTKIRMPRHAGTQPLESLPPTRFHIQLLPDNEPKLSLETVGVGKAVVPWAVIPCEVSVTDDFSVTFAALEHQWNSHDGKPPTKGADPLKSVNEALQKDQPWKSFTFRHTIELKELNIAESSSFRFKFLAKDNDAVSGSKIGYVEGSVDVVSEATLRSRLIQREQSLRRELFAKRNEQDALRTAARIILVENRDKPGLSAKVREQLHEMVQSQQKLAQDMKRIAAGVEQLVAEYKNNRLIVDEKKLQERIDDIAIPLRRLAEVPKKKKKEDDPQPDPDEKTAPIPEAADLLNRVKQSGVDPAERNKVLQATIEKQQEIREVMTRVHNLMAKSAQIQQALNALIQAERAQIAVRGLTEKEIQDRIRRALEDKNKLPKSE